MASQEKHQLQPCNLAAAVYPSIIAAGYSSGKIKVWDTQSGESISQFHSTLESGGGRLLLNSDGTKCITASYSRKGLACYSIPAGKILWHRKDITKVQEMTLSRDSNKFYCSFDNEPCLMMDVNRGETIQAIYGAREVNESHFDEISLIEDRQLDITVKGEIVSVLERETFAILAVSFSPESICISESGGSTRCFDTTSKELWRYVPPDGSHILFLGYSQRHKDFFGVEWSYKKGGAKKLLRLKKETGNSELIRTIGKPAMAVFCYGENYLLTSLGELIEVETGETKNKLPFNNE